MIACAWGPIVGGIGTPAGAGPNQLAIGFISEMAKHTEKKHNCIIAETSLHRLGKRINFEQRDQNDPQQAGDMERQW